MAAQVINVMIEARITAGTKYPATTSASFWIGARLRCEDHLHDLGEHRVGPDASGAHDETAGAVDRGADNGVADAFADGHRFARDHRLVDAARAFDDIAVDRHFFARPDSQAVSDPDVFERYVAFGVIGVDPPGRLRGQAQ